MNQHLNVINEVKKKVQRYNFLSTQIENKESDKITVGKELEKKQQLSLELDNLIYTCKIVLEKLTYANKAKLEEFLTMAVQNVFTDRDYAIELIIKEDTKKPGLELTLTEGGVQQEITDAVGGGIISTLGLLLQIYYIETYKLNKIMFIDEGLKEVSTGLNSDTSESTNYLDNLLTFLQWLSETKGYSLVIVTHDNAVRKFATNVYEIQLGRVVTS
jgi:hypothetical protein